MLLLFLNVFLAPMKTQNDLLPRQARDKHGENSKKEIRFYIQIANPGALLFERDTFRRGCQGHRRADRESNSKSCAAAETGLSFSSSFPRTFSLVFCPEPVLVTNLRLPSCCDSSQTRPAALRFLQKHPSLSDLSRGLSLASHPCDASERNLPLSTIAMHRVESYLYTHYPEAIRFDEY